MKKNLIKILSVLLLAVCLGNIFLFPSTATETAYNTLSAEELRTTALVNEQRIACGLKPLSISTALQSPAHIRVEEVTRQWAHVRPDNTPYYTAIVASSYPLANTAWVTGENLACGQASAEQVVYEWMQSTSHRANILNETFSHTGVGFLLQGYYRVQLFAGVRAGTPCRFNKIAIYNDSLKTYYTPNTPIDSMGIVLIATCAQHGSCIIPVTASMCTGYAGGAGLHTVTVDTGYGSIRLQINTKSRFIQPEAPTEILIPDSDPTVTTTVPTTEPPVTTTAPATTQSPVTVPTTTEPITEKPEITEPSATQTPSTDPSESETSSEEQTSLSPEKEPVLQSGHEWITIDNEEKLCLIKKAMPTDDFIAGLKFTKDIYVRLTAADFIGTGSTIEISSEELAFTCIVNGDIDGNGKINSSDARAALRHSARLDALAGIQFLAADTNADGNVNSSDARSILRIAAKLD